MPQLPGVKSMGSFSFPRMKTTWIDLPPALVAWAFAARNCCMLAVGFPAHDWMMSPGFTPCLAATLFGWTASTVKPILRFAWLATLSASFSLRPS